MKITPRTLSGFMELLPAQQILFENIKGILEETYALYGFLPLDTPLIEASEVLLAKGGGETEKQIYRFSKGDADLSLRFDLTVPLAKYVALHYADLAFPFRRYQIGKVYRGERAQRGRFREFYQADIDIIGDGKLDITNEAEIPAIIYRTFSRLGLKRFQIRVNNRKILNGFYAMLNLTEKSGDIMRTVDKLDKIGAEKVKALLISEEIGIDEQNADEILKFIAITGTNSEVLSALEGYKGRNAPSCSIWAMKSCRLWFPACPPSACPRKTSPLTSPSPVVWTTILARSMKPPCSTTPKSALSALVDAMTTSRSITPTASYLVSASPSV